jgi:hypothetical protein
MALSAFDDKAKQPKPKELAAVLGDSASLWNDLVANMASRFDPLAQDWGYSGKQWGWALRLKHKKRAVLYMTPCDGFFVVGFALGQKAVDAAHASKLPASILDLIDGSQQYAEGRAVRIDVRNARAVRHVIRVAEIKMAN